MRRNSEEIAKMRKAGKVVVEIKERIMDMVRPGITTMELDKASRQVLEKRGAKSNFLNYHGFPATICTSPNSMIVHGIPGNYRLKEGDIISIDCGAIVDGYHGDSAYTMGVGKISKLAQHLIDVTERSLMAAVDVMVEGNRLHDIGRVVEKIVEAEGFSVVKDYVGHGIGTAMHEPPSVPNYWPGNAGPKLKVGNVLAVEPMVNVGGQETVTLDDGWSVVTADGSLSAHFEHTIAILENGPEILTQ